MALTLIKNALVRHWERQLQPENLDGPLMARDAQDMFYDGAWALSWQELSIRLGNIRTDTYGGVTADTVATVLLGQGVPEVTVRENGIKVPGCKLADIKRAKPVDQRNNNHQWRVDVYRQRGPERRVVYTRPAARSRTRSARPQPVRRGRTKLYGWVWLVVSVLLGVWSVVAHGSTLADGAGLGAITGTLVVGAVALTRTRRYR